MDNKNSNSNQQKEKVIKEMTNREFQRRVKYISKLKILTKTLGEAKTIAWNKERKKKIEQQKLGKEKL